MREDFQLLCRPRPKLLSGRRGRAALIRWHATGLWVILFLCFPLLASAQTDPTATTFQISFSDRAKGIGYLTFEAGDVLSGYFMIKGTKATTPAGFFVVDGRWQIDAGGRVTGFFTGTSAAQCGVGDSAVNTTFTATVNQSGNAAIGDSTVAIDGVTTDPQAGDTFTINKAEAPTAQRSTLVFTVVSYTAPNLTFTPVLDVQVLDNDILHFTHATVSPGGTFDMSEFHGHDKNGRLTLTAHGEGLNITIKGIVFDPTPLVDMTGSWKSKTAKSSSSSTTTGGTTTTTKTNGKFIEFFTLADSTLGFPNLYDLDGSASGYALTGCVLLAPGGKLALTAVEDTGPVRSLLGTFKTTGGRATAAGFDDGSQSVQMNMSQ